MARPSSPPTWNAALSVLSQSPGSLISELERTGCRLQPLDLGPSSRLPDQLAEQLGPDMPHVLINVLGSGSADALESATNDDIEALVDGNLTRLLLVCQQAGRQMLGRGAGVIITVLAGDEDNELSAVTDRAAMGLMRVLGVEWAAEGVRVMTIQPSGPASVSRDGAIARSVAFLGSDDASFVTASELVVGA
jgi:NAD(P)-dependent dehydrogenase (short-subunit alcohol dehydrogenase family)